MLKTSTPIVEETSPLEDACTRPVTRRQLLRTMAAGSVALVGGAALAACSSGSSTSAVKITFYSSAWPGDSMPTAAQIKASIVTKSYADSLTKWQKQNPGVTIKHSATNIWDTQILTTAISAGTAPTWYMGNVLGSFLDPAVRAALTRGLAADLTDLIAKNNLEAQLTTNYLPVFRNSQVGGKYYGTPAGYGIGHGIYFRRDLLQQYGLQEPQPGWSWDDFRTLAKQMTRGKMHGAQMQNYIFSEAIYSNGLASSAISMGSFGLTPAPSGTYPWHLDVNSFADRYESVTNTWRAMVYTDKSLLINKNYGDSDVAAAFVRGDIALATSDVSFLTSPPSATNNASAQILTNRLNKPIDDVLGFVPNPGGPHGSFGATQAGGAIGSIDPRLQRNPAALAIAYDFLTYMIIGQGAVDQVYQQYQSTKDLKLVYNSASPMTKNLATFPNISGTAEDAWGPKTYKAFQTIALTFLIPIIVAILLMEMPPRVMRWMMLLWFLPLSSIASTVLWRYVYDNQIGVFEYIATQVLHLPHQSFLDDPNQVLFWLIFPGILLFGPGLFYMASLQSIPTSYYEAAEVEGAGFWRKIWTISLPRLRPVISVLLTYAIIGSLQEFNGPYILTGGGPEGASRTVVLYLYSYIQNIRYADGTALSIYLFAVILAIVIVFRFLFKEDPDA